MGTASYSIKDGGKDRRSSGWKLTRRRFLATLAAAGASGTTGSAQKGKKAVAGESIFELRLELLEGHQLEARLENRSGAQQRILHDTDLQPSRLTLTNTAGKGLEAFDERTRRKFDTSVSDAMYSEIAPGQNLVLERVRFEKGPGGYDLQWGPFRFDEIPPGLWKARVTFESKIDWVTGGGRQAPSKKPVWKGKLVSNEVEVKLL